MILQPARYLVDCKFCASVVSKLTGRLYKRLEFELVGVPQAVLYDFYVPPDLVPKIQWKYDQLPYDACTYRSLDRMVGRRFVVEVDVQVYNDRSRNRVTGILMEVKK